MLNNPVRPEYQDIIDEAWGDVVSDMVIRRYVDTAARDADLGGFTPDTLAGQVVAIVGAPPAAPYLQQHNGVGWSSLVSGLPAPLLAGALFQSYTDPTGEVWIAKGNVAGGVWRRARDVLYATAGRAGAFGLTTSPSNLGFDTIIMDEYQIRGTASPYQMFTAPIAGLYRMRAQLAATTTGGGQSITLTVKMGAATPVNAQNQAGGNGRLDVQVEWLSVLNAGDQIAYQVSSSVALAGVAAAFGVSPTWASFQYVGTGGRSG